ncbi:MAG: DUF1573 domain-containing protein [Chitinophagales bacterium]|nr:DUF1573 domain-containing protein [Chitinophagales bacterium]
MMRSFLILFSAATVFMSCGNNDQVAAPQQPAAVDSSKLTAVQWLDSTVNFGSIGMGEKIEVKFRFKNIGTQPLTIQSVKAGCGCTAPDYTKEAVPPGGEGEVTGAFDSNKVTEGEVRKTISVVMNTKPYPDHILVFSGTIRKAQ